MTVSGSKTAFLPVIHLYVSVPRRKRGIHGNTGPILKNGYFLVTHPKPSGLCVSFVPLWYNVCDALATFHHRETKEHKEIETIPNHRVCDGFVTVAGEPIDPWARILNFGPNAPSIWAKNDQIRYVSLLSVDRYSDRSLEIPRLGRF